MNVIWSVSVVLLTCGRVVSQSTNCTVNGFKVQENFDPDKVSFDPVSQYCAMLHPVQISHSFLFIQTWRNCVKLRVPHDLTAIRA